MRRTFNLIAALGLTSAVLSAKFPDYEAEYNQRDIEAVKNERQVNVNDTNENEFDSNIAREQNRNTSKEFVKSYDHERDFHKAKKLYNECGEKNNKASIKGEETIKTDLGKCASKEGIVEIKEKSGNCSKIKNGNRYCEEVEEKAEICEDKDRECGERVKANKFIKKRRNNNGFKENEGNAHNTKWMNGKERDWKRQNLKKCGEAAKCGKNENEANTFVNIAKRAKDLETEDKFTKKHLVQAGEQEKENEKIQEKTKQINSNSVKEEDSEQETRDFDREYGFIRRD